MVYYLQWKDTKGWCFYGQSSSDYQKAMGLLRRAKKASPKHSFRLFPAGDSIPIIIKTPVRHVV